MSMQKVKFPFFTLAKKFEFSRLFRLVRLVAKRSNYYINGRLTTRIFYCIIKIEQQCISFFERGGESPSSHNYLPYSLRKPTKKLSSANRKRFLQKLFVLNGLLHSDEMLDVAPQGFVNSALPSYACAFAIQIGVVLKFRERRSL